MRQRDLDKCINVQMIQVMKLHRHIADNAFSKLGLYAGQEIILFKLWRHDGLTQSQLAEALFVEPPTINKMVQRMEACGLLERRPDVHDGRVSRVFLTDKGRQLEQRVRAIWDQLENALTQGLSDIELALMSRILRQMRGNMELVEGDPLDCP
jgi:MarR family transcriptional regulator, organic hydroperoxide resistance regulator